MIKVLRLQTHCLDTLAHFYLIHLGFEGAYEQGRQLCIQAGGSTLIFEPTPDQTKPYYHFAFAISPQQIAEAQSFLSQKVTLLTHQAQARIHFAHWNAEALYFLDPAHNIVEFIMRNTEAKAPLPFDITGLEGLSEIGLAHEAPLLTVSAELQQTLYLSPYLGASAQFQPLGNAQHLLINVPIGRPWFPTQRPAKSFSVHATLYGTQQARWTSGVYTLEVQNS